MRQMAILAGVLALATPALAAVTGFEVTVDVPSYAGRSFDGGGTYRRITARATVALDPGDPRNAVTADLGLAPGSAQGRVEAVADVVILQPADPSRGSGTTHTSVRCWKSFAAMASSWWQHAEKVSLSHFEIEHAHQKISDAESFLWNTIGVLSYRQRCKP